MVYGGGNRVDDVGALDADVRIIGGDDGVVGIDVDGACEMSVVGVEMDDDGIVGIKDNVGWVFNSQDKLRL